MSKSLKLTIDVDTKALAKYLKKWKPYTKEDGRKAIEGVAEQIYWLSQLYVPTDSYALQESAKYSVDNDLNCTVSYGDEEHKNRQGISTIAYAQRVHDDLDMEHKQGRVKFLEAAFDEVVNGAFFDRSMLNLITRRLT